MQLRTLAVTLALAAALALGGCSPASAPKPATKPRPVPPSAEGSLANPVGNDAAFVNSLVRSGDRLFETTSLPNLTEARRAFSRTLVPRDTLGRKLVAIVYEKASAPGVDPRETLKLVYEGRLVVTEQYRAKRIRHPIMENPTRETTATPGGSGTVELLGSGTKATALVEWVADVNYYYFVMAPGLTKAEAVRIARSMAP
ncbi:MAG TPA: hypothetical protein VGK50_08815 [Coriobacteriia bacterium]|jgi:hypothetical protein